MKVKKFLKRSKTYPYIYYNIHLGRDCDQSKLCEKINFLSSLLVRFLRFAIGSSLEIKGIWRLSLVIKWSLGKRV